MEIRLRVPELGDIDQIFDNPSELATIELTDRNDVWTVVCGSDEVLTGYVDDTLVCLVGVIPASVLANSATVWMLATSAIRDHRFLFFRYGQEYLKQLRKKYRAIYCICNNRVDKRWLGILGFDCVSTSGDYNCYKLRRI